MTPTISDSERHARASLFEAGISDPSTALLRARLMLDHAKNARDLAHGWPSMFGINAEGLDAFDRAETVAFDAYTLLLNAARNALPAPVPPTISMNITRDGVTTVLSTCRLDSAEELQRVGLLAPWVEPVPSGFGTLTPYEREQTRRLAEATISYCETGCGEMATMTE